MQALAPETRSPSVPPWLLWGTWLLGPGSFGLAYVVYVMVPEFWYGTADPAPDLALGMVLILTHVVAGHLTLSMLIARGPQWRTAEFWVLLVYWAGIAGWLAPLLFAESRAIDPTIPWLCARASACAVVLMPVVGLARHYLGRTATSNRQRGGAAYTAQAMGMLATVDRLASSPRQRPPGQPTDQLPEALRALAFAASDSDATAAHVRVLSAVGNNHGGSYIPIVLDAIPFLREILAGGSPCARARTLDVLIDLVSSFEPDIGVICEDGRRPEDLRSELRAIVKELRPMLVVLGSDASAPEVQALARQLDACLAEAS